MGPRGCVETSIKNHHHTQRNIPEKRIKLIGHLQESRDLPKF